MLSFSYWTTYSDHECDENTSVTTEIKHNQGYTLCFMINSLKQYSIHLFVLLHRSTSLCVYQYNCVFFISIRDVRMTTLQHLPLRILDPEPLNSFLFKYVHIYMSYHVTQINLRFEKMYTFVNDNAKKKYMCIFS